ncbi:MAG: PepSY-like domain-containing protein [Muribaculaceae bacterium]|nr:PepSY-like domain-containing protein [Muribaculaceae bacterium]
MRKIYTLTIALLAFMTFLPLTSCNDDDDEKETVVTEESLPEAAKEFLTKFFPDDKVVKIEEENAGDIIVYEVSLESGFEIVFNSEGEWQQVEAPYYKTVPTGIIPEQVMKTLSQQYSSYGIKEINTDDQGWKVELSNNLTNEPGGAGLNLWFNFSGEITSTSQDNA